MKTETRIVLPQRLKLRQSFRFAGLKGIFQVTFED